MVGRSVPFVVPLVVLASAVLFVLAAKSAADAQASSGPTEPGADSDATLTDTVVDELQTAADAAGGLALAPPFLSSPVPAGARVSQGFSPSHHAIDFAVPVGTDLRACADAVVAQVNLNPADESGIFVILRGRGAWSQLAWSYSHMTRVDVAVGDELTADDVIGASGDTGFSTGPHLHFAVMTTAFHQIDPRPFLADVAPEVLA